MTDSPSEMSGLPDWTSSELSQKDRAALQRIVAPLRDSMGDLVAHLSDEELAKAFLACVEEHAPEEPKRA